MKAMFKDDTDSLIACLLPGAALLAVLDIEVLRAPMRVDRVYRVKYGGKEHILHLEFQTDADDDMAYRLLVYNANLWRDYKLPVISLIVYLFSTTTVTSPLQAISGNGAEILTFHFQVHKLWEYDAYSFVEERQIQMYAWLPAMENADARLLLHAIDEMVEYYQGNEAKLGEHLLWFSFFLRRAKLLSLQEQLLVEERLNTFQQLLEQDEWVRKQRALGEQIGLAKGEQIGLAKGKHALEETILTIIGMRYPSLLELARRNVASVEELDALRMAIKQVLSAPDEATARFVLTTMRNE